jgi:cytochrome b561
MATPAFNTRDPFAGYSAVSIALHWLTAIGVIALFATHELDDIHVAIGLIATPVFLVRLVWRFWRGYPRPADQPALLNLLARLVTLAFLVCLAAVTVTGLILPPLEGEALPFFGLGELTLPIPASRSGAEIAEEIHEITGNAFVPLLLLHAAGALKHRFIDKDTVMTRMIKPVNKGK